VSKQLQLRDDFMLARQQIATLKINFTLVQREGSIVLLIVHRVVGEWPDGAVSPVGSLRSALAQSHGLRVIRILVFCNRQHNTTVANLIKPIDPLSIYQLACKRRRVPKCEATRGVPIGGLRWQGSGLHPTLQHQRSAICLPVECILSV
jgi:hypothetical protein